MEVSAKDRRTEQSVPGIVFLRGPAVAVYIRVKIEGKTYVILTRQLRVPMGKLVDEIPAGMLDAETRFDGVAMREVTEETGLEPPSLDCLIPLGNTPIMPSAGGCDETIQLFYWETEISAELKDKMTSKIFGAPDENESIQLRFVPAEEYENVLLTMGDVKAICAHQFAKQAGLIGDYPKKLTDASTDTDDDYELDDHFPSPLLGLATVLHDLSSSTIGPIPDTVLLRVIILYIMLLLLSLYFILYTCTINK